MSRRFKSLAILCVVAAGWTASADHILPPIQKGTIAVNLQPIGGLAAPDYGISPPGDTDRMFIVEQNGLLRILQNDVLLPGSALGVQSRVSAPVVTLHANDDRGFLGLAFHPNFNAAGGPGSGTLYTYTSEPLTTPTYPAPNGAVQNYQLVIAEWKMSQANPNVVDPTSRREIISFGKSAGNHNGG